MILIRRHFARSGGRVPKLGYDSRNRGGEGCDEQGMQMRSLLELSGGAPRLMPGMPRAFTSEGGQYTIGQHIVHEVHLGKQRLDEAVCKA